MKACTVFLVVLAQTRAFVTKCDDYLILVPMSGMFRSIDILQRFSLYFSDKFLLFVSVLSKTGEFVFVTSLIHEIPVQCTPAL